MGLSTLAGLVPALIIGAACIAGICRGVDVFSALTAGAAKGLRIMRDIFPALVVLFPAIYLLRASGLPEHIGALLKKVRPAIVRVNYGEAAALLGLEPAEHGVDSLAAPQNAAARAAALAQRLGAVVLLSGVEDLVTDGTVVLRVQGGNDRMRMVTGAGCMLSVLCGAFAAAQPDAPLAAAAGASLFWKLCAARAGQDAPGPGTLRARLMDCAAALTDEDLTAARGQIETIQ